jgi:hypothetical protein
VDRLEEKRRAYLSAKECWCWKGNNAVSEEYIAELEAELTKAREEVEILKENNMSLANAVRLGGTITGKDE